MEKIKNDKNEYSIKNLEDFLIRSYQNPLFLSPFSKEMNETLETMDGITDYLCSIVKKSNENPLISVIMPVHNRKNIVMNSIESVLSQTYENFELIIVDDASTDGTVELLKEIQHEKIHTIFHERNKNCCGARNTALKESKGEYIAYLDSDNIMDKRFLEANLGVFLKYPDADCVYSAQARYENYESPMHMLLFGPLNKTTLLNRNYIDANVIFHKRKVLDKIDGFREIHTAEDWDFILKIVNHFKIYSAPFLQSKYYTSVADNRMQQMKTPSPATEIRENNAQFYTDCSGLNKKVDIIIPIYDTLDNINDCLDSIYSLDLGSKIKIIISNNNPNINLNELGLTNENIELIETKTNLGFSDALNRGIENCDGDILILSQNAVLTKGAIESMQKYAYELNDCGLIVSQKLVKNPEITEKYSSFIDKHYWVDIAPFEIENNIVRIPVFYDGEVLELKTTSFFCTYLKKDTLNECCGFDFEYADEKTTMTLLCDYIRKKLGLKIFHISDAKVLKKN